MADATHITHFYGFHTLPMGVSQAEVARLTEVLLDARVWFEVNPPVEDESRWHIRVPASMYPLLITMKETP